MGAAGTLAWALLLAVPVARGELRLQVSGSAQVSEETLQVRVDLTNVGEGAVGPLTVEGELLEKRDHGKVESLAPGETRSVLLRFPGDVPRPGVHALLLLLERPEGGGQAAGPAGGQCAFLLLDLGGNPPPAVRMSVPEAHLQYEGLLRASLESADGAAHRVRVRVFAPRSVAPERSPPDVEVPPRGAVSVAIPLLRAGAPWNSRQAVLVVASAQDGMVERTTVASGVVQVSPDPAWMPWLRRPLLVLALVLLAAGSAAELRRRFPRAPPPKPASEAAD